jgi:RNA polymerase sigma-70 factor (ECF subfamily)
LAALAGRAQAGDEGALAELLERCAPALLVSARTILGHGSPDLDDVVQEALLALASSLAGFRGQSSFLHYARRIAVLHALMARRRGRSRDKQAAALARETEAVRPVPSPSEERERKLRRETLLLLLEELPLAQAECLALRMMLGYSLVETAEAQGVPVNTVRSRLRLGREALRARIEAAPALRQLFDVPGSTGGGGK